MADMNVRFINGNMLHYKSLNKTQKVAVLLIALGSNVTSEVMNYLSNRQIEEVAYEISQIQTIDAEARAAVVQEFHGLLLKKDYLHMGGLDYTKEILAKRFGPEKAEQMAKRINLTAIKKPFEILQDVDNGQILNFLQQEHPQTIALLLAYLPAERASVLLSQLPFQVQSDVTKRIAMMDITDPEAIKILDETIEKRLGAASRETVKSAGGIQSIVDILNLTDRGTEKAILEVLDDEDPNLAEDIKQRMFVFENIVLLDDRDLQKVLQEVDTQSLAKAIKGVTEKEVLDKIMRNISKRTRDYVQEEIEYMGPIRRKEVDEIQQRIVGIIKRLDEEGEVEISRGNNDDLVL